MKKEYVKIYQKAFDLNNADRFHESIAEFKRIIESEGDPVKLCHIMIALLYYYQLDDYKSALPFAKQAVQLKPNSEKASLCLTHCLFDAGLQDEVEKEIRRYVATGGKIDFYQTLFDENGMKLEDFT
jgi:tetratricopeptide (TPR) repeat protein